MALSTTSTQCALKTTKFGIITQNKAISPFKVTDFVAKTSACLLCAFTMAGDIDPVTVKIANWLLIRQPEL